MVQVAAHWHSFRALCAPIQGYEVQLEARTAASAAQLADTTTSAADLPPPSDADWEDAGQPNKTFGPSDGRGRPAGARPRIPPRLLTCV